MLKILSAVTLLTIASAGLAQSTPSVTPSDTPSVTPSQTPSVVPSQTPSVTPSDTPSVTPSQSPSVVPSQTPSVTPSQTPSVAVGGLSRCENLLGDEREKCQKEERAGAGATGVQPGTPSTPSGVVR